MVLSCQQFFCSSLQWTILPLIDIWEIRLPLSAFPLWPPNSVLVRLPFLNFTTSKFFLLCTFWFLTLSSFACKARSSDAFLFFFSYQINLIFCLLTVLFMNLFWFDLFSVFVFWTSAGVAVADCFIVYVIRCPSLRDYTSLTAHGTCFDNWIWVGGHMPLPIEASGVVM